MIYDLLKDKSIPAVFTLAFVVMSWKAAFLYQSHEAMSDARDAEISAIKDHVAVNADDIETLESSVRSNKKLIQHINKEEIGF